MGFNPWFAGNQTPRDVLDAPSFCECLCEWMAERQERGGSGPGDPGAVSVLPGLCRWLAAKTAPRMAEQGFYFKVTLSGGIQ